MPSAHIRLEALMQPVEEGTILTQLCRSFHLYYPHMHAFTKLADKGYCPSWRVINRFNCQSHKRSLAPA